jgi:hypothetical protein
VGADEAARKQCNAQLYAPVCNASHHGSTHINKVTLEGTGNFVMVDGRRFILSCEHVVMDENKGVQKDIDFRFYGSDDVFGFRGDWPKEPHPVDLAIAPMPDAQWGRSRSTAS